MKRLYKRKLFFEENYMKMKTLLIDFVKPPGTIRFHWTNLKIAQEGFRGPGRKGSPS